MAKTPQDQQPTEMPFLQHLIELRDRLLRVVLVVIVVFLALFAFANDIYSYLAEPLMRHLPEGASMIATEVASPFLTPFKLTLVLSVFIAVPVILYHLWAFIAPGLYKNERRLVYPLMLSSTVLFFLGMAFAYYVVFPLVFGFLIGIAPEGVSVMTDISKYLDFVLKMFFAFGIAFEVPIATILVVWSGMTTAADLAKKRPYIIVGAFVFGMLLTPPDVISQTLLALPMWVLFELGLIFSRWYTKPQQEADEDADEPVEEMEMAGATVSSAAAGATTFSMGATAEENTAAENKAENPAAEAELSEAEMDAELDRIEAEEQALEEIQNTILPPPTSTDTDEGSGEDQDAEPDAGEEDPDTATQDDAVADSEVKDDSSYQSPELAEELRNEEVDSEAHIKATSEAEAIARAAAGDVGDYRNRIDDPEHNEVKVFTEEDHKRATDEAMAIARAAAGLPEPDKEEQETGQDAPGEDVDRETPESDPDAKHDK